MFDPKDPKDTKEKRKAVDLAVSQIERQFGKGSIMKLGDREGQDIAVISDDLALGRLRPGRRRHPARPGHRDLRPRIVGQDHPGAARRRRGPAARAASPPSSTPSTRSTPNTRGSSACDVDNLMVSQPDSRRAGAGDHRDPDPLRRRGRRRHRLGRRPRPQGRARRRDGRLARRPAGAPDVPGAAQAHRDRLEEQDRRSSSSTRSARRSA